MAGLGLTLVADILNRNFGLTTPTVAANHHFALMATLPAAGGGGVECSGGSYARAAKTNNKTTYQTAPVGATSLYVAVDIEWTVLPAGTWVGVAVYDASTGGNLLAFGALDEAVTTVAGDSLKLPANSGLQIRLLAEEAAA